MWVESAVGDEMPEQDEEFFEILCINWEKKFYNEKLSSEY